MPPIRLVALLAIAWASVPLAGPAAFAQTPPATPLITEPATDGQIVNPADVHMQTTDFSDVDAGQTHLCTDWEIHRLNPPERVWRALCIGGIEKLHIHLGDGVFENAYAGRRELEYDDDYQLRARHRDSGGDPAAEWSAYGERLFRTGSPTSIFPLSLQDVRAVPFPEWRDGANVAVVLPAGSPQPELRLESPTGGLLLAIRGLDGASNERVEPGPLAGDVAVHVVLAAGNTGGALALPETQVTFADNLGFDRTIYLPAVSLPAGSVMDFWVAADGSTYFGSPGQTAPDFSFLARGARVPWIVRQQGFVAEIVATGFRMPVNIAFVPNPGNQPDDPLYYVTELYGSIKVVRRNGIVSDYATGLLNFDPLGVFPGAGEQGVAGIVVEPQTGDLFVTLLYDAGGPHYPRVIRLHSADGGLTAASTTTVLDMAGETQGQSHQISNVTFGPDGKLYVHMGDGFVPSTAQNLASFRGKILRMNLDGTPAAGNPFYDLADGVTARDYVLARGFRNPFGGAWSPDGWHYVVENGPSVDRFTRVVAGRNYLYDGGDASMRNFAIYNWQPSHAPVNLGFVHSGLFGGSGFPAAKMGHIFVSESGPTYATGRVTNGKRIRELVVDADGNLVSGPTSLLEYNGTGKASAVALAVGPDGLYFSDFYKDQNFTSPIDVGSNILRIKFVGAAEFIADVLFGTAPLGVRFFDASTVPSASAWEWDFGDGSTSTQKDPAHVYEQDGSYDVTLRVTGPNGARVTRKAGFVCVGTPCLQGLRGEYFNELDFTSPAVTRNDPTIDFGWGNGSPHPSVGVDTFSVRWTGRVTPLFSEEYTFYTLTDDGARLWVNGQLLVDRWVLQGPTERSGTIQLVAGVPVDIRMEYFENGQGATARLFWSSPSTPKDVIPTERLAPPSLIPPPPACGPAPAAGCRRPAVPRRGSISIKDFVDDAKDKLAWRWIGGAATELIDFGNPFATTSYSLCIYDGTPSLVAQAGLPAGGSCGASATRPCWSATRSGFDYKSKHAPADGITKLSLRAGAAGVARILAYGGGTELETPVLPLATPLRVQLKNTDGVCWESMHSTASRNVAAHLKARSD